MKSSPSASSRNGVCPTCGGPAREIDGEPVSPHVPKRTVDREGLEERIVALRLAGVLSPEEVLEALPDGLVEGAERRLDTPDGWDEELRVTVRARTVEDAICLVTLRARLALRSVGEPPLARMAVAA